MADVLTEEQLNVLLSKLSQEQIDAMSEEEKQTTVQILQDMAKGDSSSYNEIKYRDYKEVPVDIITFLDDNRYLGKAWHDANGKSKLFPYWRRRLVEMFPDNLTTSYNNAIFTGARGLGKSEIAIAMCCYMMYRVMCLNNPREYYGLKPTETIAFAFMNITQILVDEIGMSKFQNTVQMSPWFMEHGTVTGRTTLIWNPPDYIHIIIGSQSHNVVGQAVLFAFFDEISFIRNKDIEQQRNLALDMINTAIGGMKTRFIKNGKDSSLLVLASSKRSDSSFLETYLKKKIESEGDNLFLVDEAVWKIQPKGTFSKEYFYVAVGNKYMTSLIIPDGEDPRTYKLKGYKVIRVPMNFKSDFMDDIDRALCDFAGESSTELSKYISGEVWARTIDENLHNPFRQEIIEVGNAMDDARKYQDFFDMDLVDRSMMKYPLYIHMDMSVAGDKTGIAGVWIKSKSIRKAGRDPSDELTYQLAFAVSIKAPKGHQISFDKNRKFIYWLKSVGFKIDGVSCFTGDTLICTPNGNKQIRDILPGELVYSYDEINNCIVEAPVEVTMNNGPRDTFIELTLDNDEIIKCTPEHPILTDRGYVKAEELLDTDEIIIDDYTYYKYKLLSTDLFVDNEYLDKYLNIIIKNLDTKKEKIKHENHHIIPKLYYKKNNLSVDDSASNIVALSYSDHALAHLYMCKCCTKKYKYKVAAPLTYFNKAFVNGDITNEELSKELQLYEEVKQEHTKQISLHMKGNKARLGQKQSQAEIEKRRQSMVGKKASDITRKHLSESHKGQVAWNKGLKWNLTEEERKQRFGRNKGMLWYTDGTQNILLHRGDYIPENFYKGRTIEEETKQKISKILTGRHITYTPEPFIWVNNGVINKRLPLDQDIPEGFVKGKLSCMSDEGRQRVSKAHLGKKDGPISESKRENIRKTNKGLIWITDGEVKRGIHNIKDLPDGFHVIGGNKK